MAMYKISRPGDPAVYVDSVLPIPGGEEVDHTTAEQIRLASQNIQQESVEDRLARLEAILTKQPNAPKL